MKSPFHYEIRRRLFTTNETGQRIVDEKKEVFENEEPILAREAAFARYHSYIDVWLESLGQKYIDDITARIEMDSFLGDISDPQYETFGDEDDFMPCLGFGIGIFMIIDKPVSSIMTYLEKDIILIHGIGPGFWGFESQIFMLVDEYEYYQHFRLKTLGYNTKQLFLSESAYLDEEYPYEEPFLLDILKTPVDWTGFDQPFWWDGSEHFNVTPHDEDSEFKLKLDMQKKTNLPTLLGNYRIGKGVISGKEKVAQTICALANTEGGMITIGMTAERETVGLGIDFKHAKGKNPRGFFLNEFDKMLSHYFPYIFRKHVHGMFCSVEGSEVFLIHVRASLKHPVFLSNGNGKEFWVRGELTDIRLSDPEEIVNYCIDRIMTQSD